MRISGPLCVSMVLLSTGAVAADQAPTFRILEPAEITRHLQTLAQLQGHEREQYRNRVYGNLVERARAQGYEMPAVPPWQKQASVEPNFRPQSQRDQRAQVAPITPAAGGPTALDNPPALPENQPQGPDMQTLVARQKRVIEEAVQQKLNENQEAAQSASGTESSSAPTAAANLYREKMRKRFDDFMARREARQRQAGGENEALEQKPGTPPPATGPDSSAPPPLMMPPQPYAMPPAPWGMPPRPMYPQPAYPQAPQPYYPQPGTPPQAPQPPAYPQTGPYGMPPFGYPPQAPGWY